MGASLLKSNPITGGIQEEYEFNVEQSKRAEQDALYSAAQRRREGERLMKEQVAQYGASGIELEGTPQGVIETDLRDAELEAMNIVYSGKARAAEMRKRAALAKSGALVQLGTSALMLGMKGGAGKSGGSSGGGSGMDARSTGTGGFTMSENTSSAGYSSRNIS